MSQHCDLGLDSIVHEDMTVIGERLSMFLLSDISHHCTYPEEGVG